MFTQASLLGFWLAHSCRAVGHDMTRWATAQPPAHAFVAKLQPPETPGTANKAGPVGGLGVPSARGGCVQVPHGESHRELHGRSAKNG